MIEDKTVTMQFYVLPYEMMEIEPGDAIGTIAHHVYRNMPLNDVYEELFGKAVKEYDTHQKRRDRRYGGIDDYMAMVDRMKEFRMPDGRSLWEYSLSLLAD